MLPVTGSCVGLSLFANSCSYSIQEEIDMSENLEETNQSQSADINEKLLLDLAWERQQKKVRLCVHVCGLRILCACVSYIFFVIFVVKMHISSN